ncbi:hypothetical protein TKK_0008483 [Trichogramma kaykai]
MTNNKDERIFLLTLSPKFWSQNDIIREFNCTEREARTAKSLASESGILTYPPKKKGNKTLPIETETIVKSFYERDDVSRMMPGMKDYICIKTDDGQRIHEQKRLLLGDLGDLYSQFKKEHEGIKIGFTKFTLLRPIHCILAGSNGTHNVCVCVRVYHENVKLMLEAADFSHLNHIENPHLNSNDYRDFLKATKCLNPSQDCYIGNYLDCQTAADLQKQLNTIFSDNHIHEITFYNWLHTDRCNITSQTLNVHEFSELLSEKLIKLKTHEYFSENQYFKTLKENLQDGEFLKNGKEAHQSIAIISNNLSHDTIAVYTYQKIIVKYLKENFDPKRIIYCTDGAAQHFKNKNNFTNLKHNEKDFGVPAEWHFSATGHGKGACDGIGANIKRGARRTSLQLTVKNHITSAESLYKWAKGHCKKTEIFLSKKTDYDQTSLELQPRFETSKAIPGTLQYHAFIPTNDNSLILKKIRSSTTYDIFPKVKKEKLDSDKNKTVKPQRSVSSNKKRQSSKDSVKDKPKKSRCK